ncbi:MAG: extracellular solute-binding protein [Burkholderiales bacterium]
MKKGTGIKVISVLLALLFTVVFAGCQQPAATESPSPAVSPEKSEAPPATEQPSEAPAEEVTIEFWHNYDAGAGQIDVLEDLIAQFESENSGIKVNHVYLEWQALKDNVVAGATTGVLPDVLRGDIGFVPQFQSLNVLFEMSSLPDYAEFAAKVLEAPNSSAKMGDKFYGLAANTNTKILFYNKDMFDAEGISVPKTQDEMWEAAKKLSKGSVVGFVEAWTGVWNVGQYIWSNGGDVLAPDYSTAQGYINGDAAVAVIQNLADLYKEKALTGPTLDPGALGDTDGWAAGQYAMEIDGPWRATEMEKAKINYGAVQMPPGSTGSVGVLGGEDFMMFKTSDAAHQEAAWKFIKFMAGKEAQIAMAKVGQMPVNIEAIEDPALLDVMPLLPVFADALKTAKARPVTPKWGDMENIIATKVAEAITGQKKVQDALDEAAAEIDALIKG